MQGDFVDTVAEAEIFLRGFLRQVGPVAIAHFRIGFEDTCHSENIVGDGTVRPLAQKDHFFADFDLQQITEFCAKQNFLRR